MEMMKGWLARFRECQAEAQAENDDRTHVLMIDDDQAFLLAVGGLLTNEGYRVSTASSGPDAYPLAQNCLPPVDVVLLDYAMPGHNGSEVLRRLQQMRADLPVIGMTGVGASALPNSFINHTCRLLLKPFRTDELIEAIETALVLPEGADAVQTAASEETAGSLRPTATPTAVRLGPSEASASSPAPGSVPTEDRPRQPEPLHAGLQPS